MNMKTIFADLHTDKMKKLIFLFFCSKKKEAKNAAATVISGKSHLLSKIRELASLRQPGFLNDHKFDFLTGNSLRQGEEYIK